MLRSITSTSDSRCSSSASSSGSATANNVSSASLPFRPAPISAEKFTLSFAARAVVEARCLDNNSSLGEIPEERPCKESIQKGAEGPLETKNTGFEHLYRNVRQVG